MMGWPRLLQLALALIAAALLGGCGSSSKSASSSNTTTTAKQPAQAWHPKPGGPFREPAQLYSKGGVLKTKFTAARGKIEIGDSPITGLSYQGNFIGPTLHLHPGDTLDLTLVNHLRQMTNTHFHGFHVSPLGNSDNVFIHVEPGQTQHYHVTLPPNHPPGLFWYHAHSHGDSAGQVYGGLAGLIVVEGLPDRLPAELRGITQRQIALKDVYTPPGTPDALPQESDIGGMNLSPATVNRTGPRTINGHYRPRIAIRPGETQLWRIANLGTNMFLKFAVPGVTFHVIAEDGNPVWKVWTAPHLVLPPGKRFEALVQGPPASTRPLRTLRIRQGDVPAPNTLLDVPPQKVGQLVSSGAPERRAKLPSRLLPPGSSPSDPLDQAKIAARRRFVFDIPFIRGRACKTSTNCPGNPKGSAGSRVLFTINGKTFHPNRNDVTPRLGTVEEWTLVNKSTSVHPFHIHQNDFQVMSVNGRPYHARSLQDIVTIPISGRVVVRMAFRDFTGRFVFHCHILDHQDGGMMATVNVVK